MVKNEWIRYASNRIASKRNGRVFWSDGRGHGRLQLRSGKRRVEDHRLRAARTFRNQLEFRPPRRFFTVHEAAPVGITTGARHDAVPLVRPVTADLPLGICWQSFGAQMR